jgi:amino acid adenylation domain-containing protein
LNSNNDILTFIYKLLHRGIRLWREKENIKLFIPEGKELTAEEKDYISSHKSSLIELLSFNELHASSNIKILASASTIAPLSFSQERLRFIGKYEDGTAIYNVPLVYKLARNIDLNRLEQSLLSVINRHDILHSFIKETESGDSYQEVVAVTDNLLKFTRIQVSNTYQLENTIDEQSDYIFHLEKEFPIKVQFIYEESSSDIYLFILIHHIAFDGWSEDILLSDLKSFYFGQGNLPRLLVQYKDFAIWQRVFLNSERRNQQLNYWQAQLSNYQPFNLLTDKKRPSEIDYSGSDCYFEIDRTTSLNLRELAKQCGVSLYSLLLSGFYLMLKTYSNQDDLVVGTPLTSRHFNQLENLIGFFVNMLALRGQINYQLSVVEYIKQIGDMVLQAYRHQDLPFEEVIEGLNIKRDVNRHPLFEVVFGVQSFGNNDTSSSDMKILEKPSYNFEHKVALFDLAVMIDDQKQKLKGVFNYATSLFTQETIKRFVSTYQLILKQFAKLTEQLNKNSKVSSLQYLDDEEFSKVMRLWNTKTYSYPTYKTIHQLFEEQVLTTPQKIAVSFRDDQLTYQDLNDKSNLLANYIHDNCGVNPDDRIAFCLDRGSEAIIAILAILKSGAAYVPIDPSYPEERAAYILRDCQPKLVLTHSRYKNKLNEILNSYAEDTDKIICIDDRLSKKLVSRHDCLSPMNKVQSNDLAYVIYTSGTTGKPKGVIVEHSALINLVFNQKYYLNIAENSRVLQFSALVFDASIWEIFSCLVFGGQLFIVDEETRKDARLFIDYLNYNAVDLATIPPAFLETLPYEKLSSLNTLIVAGESCKQSVIEKWSQGRIFINAYGPTEATVCSTMNFYQPGDINNNIGSSINNITNYVLDNNLLPCPIGVIGELFIGGAGLARGYLNNKELTDEKFIKLQDGTRLYRTGDLASWLPEGRIKYIGRNDFQVKIHGFRIELGEIEAALDSHPDIKQCVLLAKDITTKNIDAEKVIIAYYVSDQALDENELQAFLRKKLLPYQLPKKMIHLTELPLTVNGKIDREALPSHDFTVKENYVAPRNKVEKDIVLIWSEILNINPDKIGIHNDFFELGGNSLRIIKLQTRLSQLFSNIKISVSDLFKYPTINDFIDNRCGVSKNEHYLTNFPSKLEKDIAIIAMSGAFSGCDNLDAFWEMLISGKDALTRLAPTELHGKDNYVPVVGKVNDIDLFDAAFWKMSPKEAILTDPQIRKFLEHAWMALEKSGYSKNRAMHNIGVFAGSGYGEYLYNYIFKSKFAESLDMWHVIQSNGDGFLASRTSYLLGLTGPSLSVNTACSTSLVAIVEACEKLSIHRCDMALAGGVSLVMPDTHGYNFKEGGILSRNGHCSPFSTSSDGTVEGSGVGVVVLKRLSDAERDGDHILAVIKGYSMNNDGGRKSNYTAPSVVGQAECIINAQKMANLVANEIDYVECHGTGTKLGDSIEIAALHDAFSVNSQEENGFYDKCIIGAVKANIGHADSAAGIAGLFKLCKMLEYKMIPPQINYLAPNPDLNMDKHFKITTETKSWCKRGKLRVAGVSSFGVGGTNAHLIVTEYQNRRGDTSHASHKSYILPLSAKSLESLKLYQQTLSKYLKDNSHENIADIAYTLQCRREHFQYRTYVVGKSILEIIENLERNHLTSVSTKVDILKPEIVFVFPGQGSQYPNMGIDLYLSVNCFKYFVDKCIEIINERTKINFKKILFPKLYELKGSTKSLINETKWAQLGIFTINYATAKLLETLGIKSNIYLGHSIGEYVAATLAGVFELADAIAIIYERASLMQSTASGSMLSVKAPLKKFEHFLNNGLEIAAINAPDYIVVSGQSELIDQLHVQLRSTNIASVKLNTSHAFHSSMMDSILQEFKLYVSKIRLKAPTKKFVSNISGDFITEREATDSTYWVNHLRSPVKFSAGIETIQKTLSNVLFLEVGAGNALSILITKHRSNDNTLLKSLPILHSANKYRNDYQHTVDEILGLLWKNAVAIDFNAYYQYAAPRNIFLPTYQFAYERYWADRLNNTEAKISILPSNQSMDFHTPLSVEPYLNTSQTPFTLEDSNVNQIDMTIASFFYEILCLEKFSKLDSFFELGGNSILATQLMAKLNNHYNCHLNVSDIYLNQTIEQLGKIIFYVRQHYEPIVQFNKTAGARNLFMIHPGAAGCEVYIDLANQLLKEFSCYGVDSYNLYNEDKILSVKELANYYLLKIMEIMVRDQQDEYHLLGWSFGGHLCLEIAHLLEKNGITNISVYLIDTIIFSDPYSQSLLKQIDVEQVIAEYEKEAFESGYDDSYIQKVTSNLRVESKLVSQSVSSDLKNVRVILFKAMQEDMRFFASGFRAASQHVTKLPYNNVDSCIHPSKIKRILLENAHHGTALSQKDSLVKEIISFSSINNIKMASWA